MGAIIALRVNGTEYKVDVDLDGFTAGEINGVERNTGMQWLEWLQQLGNRKVSSLAWTALAWIAVRRAGQFMPFDEFEDSVKAFELIDSASPEDAEPAAEAAAKRKRSAAK